MASLFKGLKMKVILNEALLKRRLHGRIEEAQKWLDNEVLKDSAPFVPFRTGNLMHSGDMGTKTGSGNLYYTAPYAKRMYYGKTFHFSRDAHPLATYAWFESAKAQHRDKWVRGVQKQYKG